MDLLKTMVNLSKSTYILAEHSINHLQSKINDKKAYIKDYLRYKMITSQNLASEAQVKNFLFHRKVMFRSRVIQVFVFLKVH